MFKYVLNVYLLVLKAAYFIHFDKNNLIIWENDFVSILLKYLHLILIYEQSTHTP